MNVIFASFTSCTRNRKDKYQENRTFKKLVNASPGLDRQRSITFSTSTIQQRQREEPMTMKKEWHGENPEEGRGKNTNKQTSNKRERNMISVQYKIDFFQF